MRIAPEDYLLAARERVETARRLFLARDYGSAIYLAGVAAEATLRAYRTRVDPQFDAGHDLLELAGTMALEVPSAQRRDLAAAVGDLWARWKNAYRYVPASRLVRDLRRRRLGPKRGDVLEHHARVALECAFTIVTMGVTRWTSRPR